MKTASENYALGILDVFGGVKHPQQYQTLLAIIDAALTITRRDALEVAAKIAATYHCDSGDMIADEIRALITESADAGDET